MKKLVVLLLAVMACVSCGENAKTNAKLPNSTHPEDLVEVLYFHGKQRCVTCNTIERLTKELIETEFAQQVKEGKINFRTIDISTTAGEEIADKYEVTWSSLYINQWKNGEETKHNMTDFGFSCAKNSPQEFKSGITDKINELLK